MLGLIFLVLAIGGAARLAALDPVPFFNLQSSEIGKLLLVLALSGFMVERVRRLGERETTCRIVLAAIFPAMLVIAQPDLGSGLVYMAIAGAILFVAGTKWTHFLVLGGAGGRRDQLRPGGRPGGRRPGAEALPGGPPHGLPQPDQRPAQAGLPAQAVDQRDRLRAEDRPRRRRRHADEARLHPRAPHGLHLRRGGRGVRLRGLRVVLSLYALLLWRALRV